MTYEPRQFGARCDSCPLNGCGKPVPPETRASAHIAVIGDYPGIDDQRNERPFTGAAGMEFDQAIEQAGLSRRDLHITNALLCRPPDGKLENVVARVQKENRRIAKENNQRAKAGEAPLPLKMLPQDCCRPRLTAEIRDFEKMLLTGGLALKSALGLGASITDLRGGMIDGFLVERPQGNQTVNKEDVAQVPVNARPIRAMPTLHPSFVLRARRWTHVFRSDIGRAVRWWAGALGWKPPRITYHPDAGTLQRFLSQDAPFFAYDLETDGIEPLTAKIRCVGIGTADEVMVVGLLGKDGHTRFYPNDEMLRVRKVLRDFFLDETKIKVGHNAGSYDRMVMEQQENYTPTPLLDTILLHRLSGESELPHNLGFVGSMYTDAPSWKTDREGNKLAWGAETDEQLHEYCLMEGTPVITEDGPLPIEKIVRSKWAGRVLSATPSGALEWRTVTGWHYNRAPGTAWVQVSVEGQRARDRGLVCTPDHELVGPAGPVQAQHLAPGDYIYDAEAQLSEDEVCAVLGTLAGDSVLTVSPNFRHTPAAARTAALSGGHAVGSGFTARKLSELPWLAALPPLPARQITANGRTGVARAFQSYASRSLRQLAELYAVTYDANGARRLTVAALDKMGPRGLAWWLMDDGCVQKYSRPEPQNTGARGGRLFRDETIALATQGFPREDVEQAAAWFRERYGATSVGKDNVLRLGTVASRNFALAVAPYLPPEARYKLPRLRDFPDYAACAYIPVARAAAPTASLRKVVKVEPFTPRYSGKRAYVADRRYCIDVEENRNFFTPFGLVHNCGKDVAVTARVVDPLYRNVQLRSQAHLVPTDHAIQGICTEMHTLGMPVDQIERSKKERAVHSEVFQSRAKLQTIAGSTGFNPGSTQQLQELLFDKWGIEPPCDPKDRYTGNGDPSTSDTVIRSMLTLNLLPEHREFLLTLRNYRAAQKALGTYIVKLRTSDQYAEDGWDEDETAEERETRLKYGEKKVGIVDPRTGRMHPGYNAHVTTSGRLSSSKPINAQNFPAWLRTLVGVHGERRFVGADADQLELRIAASRWNASLYLRAFEAGADPHASTALAVFEKEFREADGFPGGYWDGDLYVLDGTGKWEGHAKKLRNLAKRVQYASQYGASTETVHRVLTETENDKGELIYLTLSLREVRQMHQNWLGNAKEFPQGWERELAFWREHGYLEEPVGGRRRWFLDGENLNEMVNFPIQGAGASLIAKSMIELRERVPPNCWGPYTGLVNQCHDSLMLECPDQATAELGGRILEECMNQTHPGLPGVRFSATAAIGRTWKDT